MSIFRKLSWFFKEEKKHYLLGVFALVVVAIVQLVPPKVIGIIIDKIAADEINLQEIFAWIGLLLLAAIAQYVFRFIWRTNIWGSAARLERSLRRQLFHHFTQMDHLFYQKYRTGDLMAHATNDLSAIQNVAGAGILTFADSMITGGMTLIAMMIFVDWRLTLIALIPLPLLAVASRVLGSKLHDAFRDSQEAFSSINDKAQESITGMKVLKTFGQEQEDIAELQVVIAQREEQLDEQARSVQVNGSNENYLNFIVASESFTDLVSRIDVVSKMVSANKELVEQQIADQKAVEDKKSKTEENLSKINAMAMELEQLKGDLQVKKIEQESAIAALAAEKATAESDRQMFLAQKEEADQRAAAEAAAIAAAEAAAATVAATVAQASSEESSTAASSVDIASSTVASSESAAPAQTVAAAPVVESAPVVSAPAAAAPVVSAPVVSAPVVTAPTLSAPTGDVVSIAAKYIGVPYVWGGKTPSGFDCSGFTSYVFREAYGIEIGGYTVPQENSGTQIAVSSAQAGDLIFWGSRGATYHVAIYVGGGQYIHAPAPGQTVTYSSYNLSGASFAVRVAR